MQLLRLSNPPSNKYSLLTTILGWIMRTTVLIALMIALSVFAIEPALAGQQGSLPLGLAKSEQIVFITGINSLIRSEMVCQNGGILHDVFACLCQKNQTSPNRGLCYTVHETWLIGFYDDGYRDDGNCQWDRSSQYWPPDDDDPTWDDIEQILCQNISCWEIYGP